jgi:hypothetical protein
MSATPIYDALANPEAPPKIPAKWRTRVYVALLIVSAIALITSGVTAIWLDPLLAANIDKTVTVISNSVGLIAGGLGFAFRPTR